MGLHGALVATAFAASLLLVHGDPGRAGLAALEQQNWRDEQVATGFWVGSDHDLVSDRLQKDDASVNDADHNPCRARLATQGEVVGTWFETFPTCTYKGIPYARAPVGQRRFAPPEPAKAFSSEPFYAAQFGPGCVQACTFGQPDLTCPSTTSEDCLSVNVFTPQSVKTLRSQQALPVLIFFHGGNYVAGSGGVNLYHGSRWSHEQSAVVVTLNYRLGVLGGLYTKRGGIQGNFQLQDQRLAMQWVQTNIAAFGGDPQLVTIFGQSAGAFSVAAHLASPRSWPFFQRAAAISDPIALPTETTAKSEQLSKRFVNAVGCGHIDEVREEACLRNLTTETILTVQEKTAFPTFPGMMLHKFMPWTPVVDGTELPFSPMEAAARGKLASVPMLIGSVANESVAYIWDVSPDPMPKLKYELFIEAIFGPLDAHRVFHQYGPPDQAMTREGDVRKFLTQIATDYIFTCSIRAFAKHAAQTNPVFVYYYNHLPSFNHFMQDGLSPGCEHEICHGCDLAMLFNTMYLARNESHQPAPGPTPAELILSSQMQTVWTNFARTGNPNSPRKLPRQSDSPEALFFPKFNVSRQGMLTMQVSSHPQYDFREVVCDMFDKIGYEVN
ncbi:Acetylcholinesterase 1 [Hondaea fermentalgiana]|uniref:Carboxylic ester hydrolase n=1 Tax=Hondaea fermentalgiana TaxID=2315210 RepID=A0A2R5GXD5_9STRA|nr:Acetylcholinesterase 1 [Hondaea fermentalgiana]|eukprot:GBG33071.1 Acetylcholinesterase 1 [Hondaea fermentalgiana]